jgi:predicted outer membrane repeat protein
MIFRYLVSFVLLAFLSAPALATTHVVDVNGTGDYTAIGMAVYYSSEGDTILVLPGTYSGSDNNSIAGSTFHNFVLLADTSTREPVILDGEGTAPLFNFNNGQDASTIVRGFTIQNGYSQGGSAFRLTSGSSPTIEDCLILNNHGYASGGALYMGSSAATIRNCTFRGNTAVTKGGAITAWDCSTMITGCVFEDNTVESFSLHGGAIYSEEGSESVVECTFVRNGPDQIKIANGNGADVANCIIVADPEGVPVTASPPDGVWTYRCIIFDNAGGDTPLCNHEDILYEDPRFCNSAPHDFNHCEDSAALPANNPWSESIGAGEAGCEACGSPVEDSTWGAVKALFR